MTKHARKIPFEYSRITPFIFIGTNQCCTTHFEGSLIKKGVRADISLEDKRLDAPWGATFFLWLPTKDHTPPAQTQLRIGVGMLHELISNKVKVYVHCRRGHGRAPTLVAAYLISTGISVEDAIELIKQKRKVTHLDKSQIRALHTFRKNLKKKRPVACTRGKK